MEELDNKFAKISNILEEASSATSKWKFSSFIGLILIYLYKFKFNRESIFLINEMSRTQ
jgi:hypothetical protein